MNWPKENFNLVSIIDIMFSFTGILLFLIWGFSSIPKEKQMREAKKALEEYYSFVIKKGKLTTIKARRDFIFQLKPMVFIVDSNSKVKYLSPKGYPSIIPWEKTKEKIEECVKFNQKNMDKKHLCGVVFMVPPEGFSYIKDMQEMVWNLLKNTRWFLPLSFIPMKEEMYERARALWEK